MGRSLVLIAALIILRPCVAGAEPLPSARLLVSNATPYVGEETLLTLELRSAPRPGAATLIWPDLAAFVVADLPLPAPRRAEGEGGLVLVQAAHKALLPLAAGPVPLSGAAIQLGPQRLAAAPLTVRVRPLPAAGRPHGFSGAVGRVEMTLAAAGRGSREIVVTLTGNAPLGDFPPPTARPGRNERLVLLADTSSGTAPGLRHRELRYLYLPGADARGSVRFELPIFDPLAQRYQTLSVAVAPRHYVLPLTLAAGATALLLVACTRLRRRRDRPPPLQRVLQRALGMEPAALPQHRIIARLAERGVPPDLLAALREHWREEEAQRFAPHAASPAATAHRAARRLARQLGKAVDKRRRFP